MITIDLLGGLGNQLFQYALGRALEARGHQIQFNPSRLDSDAGRIYLLGDLGLRCKLVYERPGRAIYEGSLRYRPDILQLQDECSLTGYWQCERYFINVREQLLTDVFRGMSRSDRTEEMCQRIRSYGNKSCFLHVRRSDNLSPRAIMYHGLTCARDNTYYERAKSFVRQHVPDVHFFVFSEDHDWIRANMNEPDMTVVDINPMSGTVDGQGVLTKNSNGRECEDLLLMSMCSHAIIANSTFSWWGAWLNSLYDGRLVITPDPWFATPDADSTDIIPERWHKIAMR